MNETLVKIHNVDIDAVGLGDFGKRGITSLRDKSLPFMNNCHFKLCFQFCRKDHLKMFKVPLVWLVDNNH